MSVRFCVWYTVSACPLECDWKECENFEIDDLYKDKVFMR